MASRRSDRKERGLGRGVLVLLAGLTLAPAALASGAEIVLTPEWKTLIGMMALFVLLVFPVNALLFRPILRALDAREEKIDGTRERARKLAGDADELLGRYERAVAEARESAEQERRQLVSEARSRSQSESHAARGVAEQQIEAARQGIASELVQARETLRQEARGLAREAASRVLGRPLS